MQVPRPFNDKTQSRYRQNKLKKAFKRRAGIEPVIGHLKADHRLSRNFYRGVFGDNINVMLAAAGFNFKRMMRKWAGSFWHFLLRIWQGRERLCWSEIFMFQNLLGVFKA